MLDIESQNECFGYYFDQRTKKESKGQKNSL